MLSRSFLPRVLEISLGTELVELFECVLFISSQQQGITLGLQATYSKSSKQSSATLDMVDGHFNLGDIPKATMNQIRLPYTVSIDMNVQSFEVEVVLHFRVDKTSYSIRERFACEMCLPFSLEVQEIFSANR